MEYIVFRDDTITEDSQRVVIANGITIVNEPNTFLRSRYLETLLRGSVQNYRKIRREGGLLPLNQYKRTSLSSEYISGSYNASHTSEDIVAYFSGKPNLGNINSWQLAENSIDQFISSDELQYVVQKAAAKFYTGGFDALTFLAEFKQLIAMFAGLVPTLLGLVRKTPLNQFGRKLADLDLQWRYGWRTFYYELQEIAQLLERLDDADRKLFKARGESHAFISPPPTFATLEWDPSIWSFTSTVDVTVSYRGLVVGSAPPPRVTFNPLLTAWEVVRLSFVLDWFVNVGQWLAALQYATFHPEHVSAGGYQASVVKQTTGTSTNKAGWSTTADASFTSILEVRARIPMEVSQLPIWKLRLDSWKILDLLALLTQALTRKG